MWKPISLCPPLGHKENYQKAGGRKLKKEVGDKR